MDKASEIFSQDFNFKEAEEAPDDQLDFKDVYFNMIGHSRQSNNNQVKRKPHKKNTSTYFRGEIEQQQKQKEKEIKEQQEKIQHQINIQQQNIKHESDQEIEQQQFISTTLIQNQQHLNQQSIASGQIQTKFSQNQNQNLLNGLTMQQNGNQQSNLNNIFESQNNNIKIKYENSQSNNNNARIPKQNVSHENSPSDQELYQQNQRRNSSCDKNTNFGAMRGDSEISQLGNKNTIQNNGNNQQNKHSFTIKEVSSQIEQNQQGYQTAKAEKKNSLSVGSTCVQIKKNKKRRYNQKNQSLQPNMSQAFTKKQKPFNENRSSDTSLDTIDDDVEDDYPTLTQKYQQISPIKSEQSFPNNLFKNQNYLNNQQQQFSSDSPSTSDQISNIQNPYSSKISHFDFNLQQKQQFRQGSLVSQQTQQQMDEVYQSHINAANNMRKNNLFVNQDFNTNKMSSPNTQTRSPMGVDRTFSDINSSTKKNGYYQTEKLVKQIEGEQSIITVRIDKVNIKPFQTVTAVIISVDRINQQLIQASLLKPSKTIHAILKQSYSMQNTLKIGQEYIFKFQIVENGNDIPVIIVNEFYEK